ncbi:hypothetical protein FZC66_00585 [Priestia megaterium]|nr:hypothetical protein FZC66_00585 [Priestia megaterium]
MARSNESMPRSMYVKGNDIRYMYPKEAILLRDKGLLKDSILFCENYNKCGCRALVSPVNRGKGFFRLIPSSEGHSSNCEYMLNIQPIETRIRNVPKDKKIVLKIDNEDIFAGSPGTKTKSDKGNVHKNNTSKLPTTIVTRTVPGTRNEYIRNVSELIDLLNSDNTQIIVDVLKQLYSQKMYYKRDQYKDLWGKRPDNTFMVEGFLDKRKLQLLDEKDYVYAYSDPIDKPDSIRLMLVHNGQGKEKFKAVIKDLLKWIESRDKENRKLAIIKGEIVGSYEDSNILIIHVKDIDIKYRKKEYKK